MLIGILLRVQQTGESALERSPKVVLRVAYTGNYGDARSVKHVPEAYVLSRVGPRASARSCIRRVLQREPRELSPKFVMRVGYREF